MLRQTVEIERYPTFKVGRINIVKSGHSTESNLQIQFNP